VRERGAPKSQEEMGECGCIRLCWCPRKVQESCLLVSCFVLLWWLFFFFFPVPLLEWSLHAPFIDSRRCRVTKCWHVVWSPEASGGPYPVATWSVLWRHGVGTSGTAATCPGMWTTAEGVVSVFRYCSDVPCRTCSCSRRGVFVLVV
jgi:hypothetical protein